MALLLSSCAGLGTKLSPEGAKVRPVSGEYKDANCSYAGITEQRGVAIEGGYISALTKVRNEVARVGGNAFHIISERPEQMGEWTHYNITAEVLRCRFNRDASSSFQQKEHVSWEHEDKGDLLVGWIDKPGETFFIIYMKDKRENHVYYGNESLNANDIKANIWTDSRTPIPVFLTRGNADNTYEIKFGNMASYQEFFVQMGLGKTLSIQVDDGNRNEASSFSLSGYKPFWNRVIQHIEDHLNK